MFYINQNTQMYIYSPVFCCRAKVFSFHVHALIKFCLPCLVQTIPKEMHQSPPISSFSLYKVQQELKVTDEAI